MGIYVAVFDMEIVNCAEFVLSLQSKFDRYDKI